ncbi:hypothetical protein HMPREF9318_01430 [Streptococcus urinalis FB127-CNA-2]|uniref:GBS Bsp-like repeat protein n=2 Tax=Streptococcus urinalis TaxID=149016 RepID=G5KD88_9STRE|nr:GBS Bsp-like repeat-containing protein [Streptococcus urinalis]EHJ57440.1 GBS Bsp-like repeat protein [Streptococcus urinalis 2285-97]EKS19354.1 hypothetical protein HMPREF9318_01430 [Streptococcus urinalis FB127-CNA-2]VEF31484.1 N-acetylmuramoyl-L-alanine amidase [Streptococcus urinalis]
MFAVWTENKGQDDLRWYKAVNNTFTVDLTKEHKEYGKYNIHTYVHEQGKTIYSNALTYNVEKKVPSLTVSKVSDERYHIVVENVGKEITTLSLPIWSQANNQDDLKWIKAIKNSDDTYSADLNLADHHYETGLYNIHVYGDSSITSQLEGLTSTTINVPALDVKTSLTLVDGSTIKVDVTNLPSYIKSIVLPTWTENAGQDDLIWEHTSLSPYGFSGNILLSNHKYETGLYHIHVYANTVDGQLLAISANTFTIPTPKISARIDSVGNNNYQVTVTDVPNYLTSISMPVWSDKNGQDDLVWHKTTKSASDTYIGLFNLSQHKDNIGNYHIAIYGTTPDGSLKGLTTIIYDVKDIDLDKQAKYNIGQLVEIQSYATNESNGYQLVNHQQWIGTIQEVNKNTNNAIGGWEYKVSYANGEHNDHVLEQDLRYVFNVDLKQANDRVANNRAIQAAFDYAKQNKDITLYLPAGSFTIGSSISEATLSAINNGDYVLLSSDTKLRGNDKGTTLIVDGTMLWFGLPTGSNGSDGVHNLTLTNMNIRAKDMINGNYFMVMFDHGNNIRITNNSFTMVQTMSRHIFDLEGVQNITFENNKFVGYAHNLLSVTSTAGHDLHDFYAEAIQLDLANNKGGWDAQMIKKIDEKDYMAFNSKEVISSNVSILNNQFIPYFSNGQLIAYSTTVGQHSSQVGNVKIVGNRFEKTLSSRYNDSSWVMKPIHYVNASGYGADVRNNVII